MEEYKEYKVYQSISDIATFETTERASPSIKKPLFIMTLHAEDSRRAMDIFKELINKKEEDAQ